MGYNNLVTAYNALFDIYTSEETAPVMASSITRPKTDTVKVELHLRDVPDIGKHILAPFSDKTIPFSKLTFKKPHGRKELVFKASEPLDADKLTAYMGKAKEGTLTIELL